ANYNQDAHSVAYGYVVDIRAGSAQVSGNLLLQGIGLDIEAGGTLEVTNDATIYGGYAGVGVTVDGTLQLDSSGSIQAPLTGAGHLVLGGGSIISFAGGSSFTGTIDVNGPRVTGLGSGFGQLNLHAGFANISAGATGTIAFDK